MLGFNNASQSLERLVSTPLIEKTFHMKVQARKLFAHREGCEVILGKADDQLTKVFCDLQLFGFEVIWHGSTIGCILTWEHSYFNNKRRAD